MSGNTALEVLETARLEQSGLVDRGLVEAVYAAALKYQYDNEDDSALRDAIRKLVSDVATEHLDVSTGSVEE